MPFRVVATCQPLKSAVCWDETEGFRIGGVGGEGRELRYVKYAWKSVSNLEVPYHLLNESKLSNCLCYNCSIYCLLIQYNPK